MKMSWMGLVLVLVLLMAVSSDAAQFCCAYLDLGIRLATGPHMYYDTDIQMLHTQTYGRYTQAYGRYRLHV
ncbi:hypothetical protein NFI96_007829 [Prochilodus magdalenae]|nr:hypothetical protein NFI96_007829 [Prochilodus magdalenae]